MARPLPPMYSKVRRKVTRVAPRPTIQIDPKEQAARELQAQQNLRKTPEQVQAEERVAAESAANEAKKAKRREANAKRQAAKPAKKAPKPAKKAAKAKPAAKAPKPAKKAAKAKPAAKKIKWSEDMTQKQLYAIAKKAGLNVRAKDWKSEIIRELKKAT